MFQSAISKLAIKPALNNLWARMASGASTFKTLNVTVPKPFVYSVELNRPEKANSMNNDMWREIPICFDELSENPDCRVVIISGAGKLFTAGIDFQSLMSIAPELAEAEDVARKAKILGKLIRTYQNTFTAIEKCNKPVIGAIHSACIGAGVDLITATDIRLCTKDAWFCVKEVDLGLAADVGTLQRLPKVIGSQSLVRDLCFTARKMFAPEALSSGLISQVFENKESMLEESIKMGELIASKSPVAVQGTKRSLNYARDHSVDDSLEQIATWNQFMLQSDDFTNAVVGQATKNESITFSKL